MKKNYFIVPICLVPLSFFSSEMDDTEWYLFYIPFCAILAAAFFRFRLQVFVAKSYRVPLCAIAVVMAEGKTFQRQALRYAELVDGTLGVGGILYVYRKHPQLGQQQVDSHSRVMDYHCSNKFRRAINCRCGKRIKLF